ncbi:MAG: RdgB/HAM1 family non-canonical purine NTP pyrophosphatase [Campylobacterota bacterium]
MQKIILATQNKGKVKELQKMFDGFSVVAYSDLIEPFEIVEDAHTFKDNALIKARAVAKALEYKHIVLADDSGITVPLLDNEPGIYSARYAGVGADDKQNVQALIDRLRGQDLQEAPAFYTAAIAVVCGEMEFTTHGFMHGKVINEARGNNGFGYDPIFIPQGFKKTLGELDEDVKKGLSHRYKAVDLMRPILQLNCKED